MEYFYDPNDKIPPLKYLYDEGMIGYFWEKNGKKDIVVAFDHTNLGIDFDLRGVELIFKLNEEVFKVKPKKQTK
jgi:hypothetical protein